MISQELLLQIAKDHSVTSGEMEVLGAIILSGETISDVATRLNLQPEAVRKRLGEVYRKFGITGKGPGKLAKLQQLLMKNPAPKVQEFSPQYSTAGLGSRTKGKRKGGQIEVGTDSDYLGSRSISDLSKGKLIQEVVNRDLLISDLEKYTGFEPDWDSAPDIEPFYDREQELEQLRQWIVVDRSRLVVLYGMAGIGKTSLAVKIGQDIEKEFDVLIWRSLKHAPSLAELIAGIEDFINPGYISSSKTTLEENINRLINYLRDRRCLIILDDLECILEPETTAGQYKQEHSQYKELVKRIALENIQSCLVLVSNEKIADLAALESNKVHSLPLEGSPEIANQIITNQGLEKSHAWNLIINNYRSHPLALKIIVSMIKDLYDGEVEGFLRYLTFSFDNDFQELMTRHLNRLSSSEKDLMYTLAFLQRPVSIAELHEDCWLNLSSSELIEVMTSLRGRSLLERQEANFSLQPMVWRHTVDQLINEVAVEITNFLKTPEIDNLKTLKSYPWQIEGEEENRLLSLMKRYFTTKAKGLGKELPNLVKTLEENYESQSGYAIENLKALINLLGVS